MREGGLPPNVPTSIPEFERLALRWLPMLSFLRASDVETYRNELLNVHFLARWLDVAMPTFELTRDLLAALILTDPGDVDGEDVRFPFPSFVVAIPGDFWTIVGVSGAVERVAMLVVHSYRTFWVSDPDGPEKDFLMLSAFSAGGTNLWDRTGGIPTSGSIREWLELRHDPGAGVTPDEERLQILMRRVAANVALYVAEKGRGKRRGPSGSRSRKRRSARRRARLDKPKPTTWVLGSEVKLDAPTVAAARDDLDGGARWSVSKRFVVRGHFRNQAHGPGRTLRKRIFVAPFWKGPRDAPRLADLYRGGEEGGDE
jgi:hypothetical protein